MACSLRNHQPLRPGGIYLAPSAPFCASSFHTFTAEGSSTIDAHQLSAFDCVLPSFFLAINCLHTVGSPSLQSAVARRSHGGPLFCFPHAANRRIPHRISRIGFDIGINNTQPSLFATDQFKNCPIGLAVSFIRSADFASRYPTDVAQQKSKPDAEQTVTTNYPGWSDANISSTSTRETSFE
jgi:hypothetical protein